MTMFQPAITANDLEQLVAKFQKQLNLEALAYLESREIHEKTISGFGLGYEEFKIGFAVEQATGHLAGRIIFPIRDIDGRMLDLIGRLIDDREPKYKSLLGCSLRDILHGNVEPEKIKQANERYQEVTEHMWTMEANVDASAEEIVEYIQRIAQTIGKMPIVFLDALHHICSAEEAKMLPSTERTARVLYELQQVARELNCPLIVTANEDKEDSRLLTRALDATADVLVRLTHLDRGEPEQRFLQVEVQKNRNGGTGKVEITFDQQVTLFKPLGSSERKTGQNGADLTSA